MGPSSAKVAGQLERLAKKLREGKAEVREYTVESRAAFGACELGRLRVFDDGGHDFNIHIRTGKDEAAEVRGHYDRAVAKLAAIQRAMDGGDSDGD